MLNESYLVQYYMLKKNLLTNIFILNFIVFLISISFILVSVAHTDEESKKIAEDILFTHQPLSTNACQGYYTERNFSNSEKHIKITANNLQVLENNISLLKGNVEAFHANKYLRSKTAKVYPDDKTNKIKDIELFDNVKLFSEGAIINGNYAKFDILNNTGIVKDAIYRINISSFKDRSEKYFGHGKSEVIIQEKEKYFNCKKVSFTTCTPYINSWHMRASKLDIDQEEQMAYAKHAIFYIRQVPVFYLPYFSFPISDERKSGFLYPWFNYSNSLGAGIKIPYYLNLAPNYDATLSPEYIHKHGMKFNGEFRFLSKITEGTLQTSFIQKDKTFINTQDTTPTNTALPNKITNRHLGQNRGEVKFKESFNFSKKISGAIDVHAVSDDDYLQDFNNSFNTLASNNLAQSAKLAYADPNWRIASEVIVYQTLSPSDLKAVTSRPYFNLPKITADTKYHNILKIVNVDNTAGYTNYWNPQEQLFGQWKQIQRYRTKPSLEINLEDKFGFIRPKVAVHVSKYNMYKFQLKKGKEIDLTPKFETTKIIPIYTVDSSLILEKLGEKYSQKLTARVMYSYIPEVDQNKIISLDSGYNSLSFNNLFKPNRFSGFDRVGDTKQISYGLSTDILPIDSNVPFVSMGIGQITYFKDRKVTICTTAGCSDNAFLGYVPIDNQFSPIAAFFNLQVNKILTWKNEIVYSHQKQSVDIFSSNLQYKPDKRKILNIGYSHIINGDQIIPTLTPTDKTQNLDQVNISTSLPINTYWSFYAGMSYNINADYFRHYFSGLEYNSCCWAIRLLTGRAYMGLDNTDKPKFDDKVYIQFVLKGLGSYATDDIHNLLKTHIPGFQDHLV